LLLIGPLTENIYRSFLVTEKIPAKRCSVLEGRTLAFEGQNMSYFRERWSVFRVEANEIAGFGVNMKGGEYRGTGAYWELAIS
jgi:hypothetical protein